jgi:hypothetical protein
MATLIIGGGGPPPPRKKRQEFIGGDRFDDEESSEEMEAEEDSPRIDGKREAAAMLVKALGGDMASVGRVQKAMEAMIYACQGDE